MLIFFGEHKKYICYDERVFLLCRNVMVIFLILYRVIKADLAHVDAGGIIGSIFLQLVPCKRV